MPEHRILLVDDDRAIVQAVSVRLRALGYTVLTAFDGAAGLAAAVAERPEAVVLDIRMPGIDGLTVLDNLRKRDETRNLPVVMLSASVVDEKNALDRGAQFFLQKPYDARALIAALSAVVAQKQKGQTPCQTDE